MPALITTLIDRPDGFELVRDEIAAILAVELEGQRALATAGGRDPEEWRLDVYVERSNSFEQWLENPATTHPIVNVWFESYEGSEKGSAVRNEKGEGVFYVDCFGYGVSRANGTGHLPGDELAAREAQRAARLCRQILMAEHYTYLGNPPGPGRFIFGRHVRNIHVFQPEINLRAGQNVVGARLALEVKFKNDIPQVEGSDFDLIQTTVRRAEDGKVLVRADYPLS